MSLRWLRVRGGRLRFGRPAALSRAAPHWSQPLRDREGAANHREYRERDHKILNLISFREADDLRTEFCGEETQRNESHQASCGDGGKDPPAGDLQRRGRNQEYRERKRRRHQRGETERPEGMLLQACLNRVQAVRLHHLLQAGVTELSTQPVCDGATGQRACSCSESIQLLERVLPEQGSFEDFEVAHDFPVLGKRVMLLDGRTLRIGDADLMFVSIEDLTERKRIHDELVRSNEDLQRLAYVASHDLRTPFNAAVTLVQLLTAG